MIKVSIIRNDVAGARKMWAVRDGNGDLRAAGIYGNNTYENAALLSQDEYDDLLRQYNEGGKRYDLEPVFWTFENDEEVQDYEELTRASIEELANDQFAEQCQDESPKNGETFEHPVAFIAFQYDDDERVILERIDTHLEYEHYHGDLAEHGTHGL